MQDPDQMCEHSHAQISSWYTCAAFAQNETPVRVEVCIRWFRNTQKCISEQITGSFFIWIRLVGLPNVYNFNWLSSSFRNHWMIACFSRYFPYFLICCHGIFTEEICMSCMICPQDILLSLQIVINPTKFKWNDYLGNEPGCEWSWTLYVDIYVVIHSIVIVM